MRKLIPWLLLAAFLWFYLAHYRNGETPAANPVDNSATAPDRTVTTTTEQTTTEQTTPAATPEIPASPTRSVAETAPATEESDAAAPLPSLSPATPSGGEGDEKARGGPEIGTVEGAKAYIAPVTIPIVVRADRDGEINHCEGGTLELKGPELHYDCPPPHEGKSVHLMLSEVKMVDKNGIQLQSNKKYHFHVRDMSDSGVEQMFRNWLAQPAAGTSTIDR